MKIYADNAATTRLSDRALDAMKPFFQNIYGNPSSLHKEGQIAAEFLSANRKRIAKGIGADEKEIYFTASGSESDNQALVSAAMAGKIKGKTHIISSAFEHHAVLHTLNKLEKQGFDITLLDVHKDGIISIDELESSITPLTAFVSIMSANNEIGTLQPIEDIGALCKKHGIIFHTDAVQAVGNIAIDVKRMNIDMLSLSAHKFHGPKGVGALYCKKGIPVSTLIEGGAQERKKRAGTENLAGIAGMAEALEEAIEGMDKARKHLIPLRDRLIEGLLEIPSSILNGHLTKRLPGTVNVCFEGIEGEGLLLLLDDKGIAASSGSACTSGSLDPSHVLLALGLPHEIAHGSLRLSLARDITKEEIEYIIKSVGEVVSYLRSMSPVWKKKLAQTA